MNGFAGAQNIPPDIKPFEVDRKSYFLKHDIVYRSPAYDGFEGFPLGNGDLGGMVWCTPSGLKIQINKSDTYDRPNEEARMVLRSCGRLDIDFGAPCFDWIHLKDFEGRLSLYDAEASFAAESPFMSARIKSVVAMDENVWLIECGKTEDSKHLDRTRVRVGLERWGSRAFPGWYGGYNSDPEIGLGKAETGVDGSVIFMTEEFEGLNFALACKLLGQNSNGKIISRHRAELETEAFASGEFSVLVAVATSRETAEPLQKVMSMLEGIGEEQIAKLKSGHKKWWESFWQRSFVHLPDDYIENIYYFKRYLLASSSRDSYPALFNAAIFTWNHDIRNWVTPHHWNMQQIYWGNDKMNDTYWRNGKWEKFEGFSAGIYFDEALKFIGQAMDEPFFIYLATNVPHGPMNVLMEWREPYEVLDLPGSTPWGDTKDLYATLNRFDYNIGRLREYLSGKGLDENTILIFLTDNGSANGTQVFNAMFYSLAIRRN
jgi:hypothetical protein